MSAVDVRATMQTLPAIFQPLLTWLTAKPLSVKGATRFKTGLLHVLTTCLLITVGVASTVFVMQFRGLIWGLLPLAAILTVSGMRKLQVVIYHHCAHYHVFNNRLCNNILGELISIVLLIKDFSSYQQDHMLHHSAHGLLTHKDETVQDLASVGLRPGLSKRQLYRNLFISFISPFAHLRALLARISTSLCSPYWQHNLIAMTYWILLFYAVDHFHCWVEFGVAWLIPLFFLYHISRTLRLVVEHIWPAEQYLDKRNLDFISASTHAIFLGEPLPTKTNNPLKNLLAYSIWWFRMLIFHLFPRVFVLVGDTPCHDHHHRHPSAKNWTNYIYARHEDSQKTRHAKMPYQEIWGFLNAIDISFTAMSQVKPHHSL